MHVVTHTGPPVVLWALAVAVLMLATSAFITGDSMTGTAFAAAGSNADYVTFIKQDGPSASVDAIIADSGIDASHFSITHPDVQRVQDAGHDIYMSVESVRYGMLVNPVDDHTNGFNPFAQQGARYALNYMFDRDGIVSELIGSGLPILSALSPSHQDYPLVREYLESLGFEYDLAEADRLIEAALMPTGAYRTGDGMWYYGDDQIEITLFIRSDDSVRHQIGERLAADLESIGFKTNKIYGTLGGTGGAYGIVYQSDPRDQLWHIYTAAWSGPIAVKYEKSTLAQYYGPWAENLPGGDQEGLWRYENELLDRLTLDIYNENYTSSEERQQLVVDATIEGVKESVHVFLAVGDESSAVRDGVSGVVAAQGLGISSRYTPLNIDLPDGDTNFEVGVRHVVQSPWNTVGGFGDVYGLTLWDLLRDFGLVLHPHTGDILDGRIVTVSVDTAGPDDKIQIPAGAIMWDAEGDAWTGAQGRTATSKVVYDLLMSDWHHGQPMEINDILYSIAFNAEYIIEYEDPIPPKIVAVEILDEDTIAVYVDYWHFDPREIVAVAEVWPTIPWELYAAMNAAVRQGDADWGITEAEVRSGNWLDMIDTEDVRLVRGHLDVLLDEARHNDGVPDLLHGQTSQGAIDRYTAAISWLDEKGHMVISNGPFYLPAGSIVRDAGGDITSMQLEIFDDPTYPFGPDKWSAFVTPPTAHGATGSTCR